MVCREEGLDGGKRNPVKNEFDITETEIGNIFINVVEIENIMEKLQHRLLAILIFFFLVSEI